MFQEFSANNENELTLLIIFAKVKVLELYKNS